MSYAKIALFAAVAALASAQTQQEIDELNVILNDVKSHLQEYMSLAQDSSSGFSLANMPAGVLNIGMALASATDNSYTTLYSAVDFAGVNKMLTMVPWYSSRLEPALKSMMGDESSSTAAPSSSAAPSSTEAKSSSAAPTSSAATSSAAASSTEAKSSSAAPTSSAATSSAAASSTEAKSSAAASSTQAKSSAAASSAASSSAKQSASVSSSAAAASGSAKASAISQITDGQVQATKTVSQQTENGAAKAFVGMGAGVVAAAAMLL
ncbi:hypothetical protein SUVZ_05G0810 [Saccharomyces uvarum]|uniref:Uncharacterized protein n=1 Tax=Saccharomyces uvarum TaxID=230603 RepID=A0ABN8WRQ4_SACUV|nr:hypothetical protein SUVZ_05G0810 [Saccharomyces uvarum]